MILRPRIYVEALVDGTAVRIPAFQCKVENLIGINADWFELSIANNNNEYDWIFQHLDSLEFKIYVGMSKLPISADYPELKNELADNCIMHGFAGPTSKTVGSEVNNIISVSGGDICYRINKRFTGDKLLQRTPSQRKEVNVKSVTETLDNLENSFKFQYKAAKESPYSASPPWPLLAEIFGLNRKDSYGTYTDKSPERINIVVSDKFKSLTAKVSSMVLMDYVTTVTEQETQAGVHLTKYQVNNASLLEVLDDICVKTGFEAMGIRGTRDIVIYENIDDLKATVLAMSGDDSVADDPKAYKSLNDVFVAPAEEIWLNKNDKPSKNAAMFCKIGKYPGFEDGLALSIAHWNWKASNANPDGVAKVGPSELIQASGVFLGNSNPETNVTYKEEFDAISKAGIIKKTYRAMNRLISNRYEGQCGIADFNPNLIPGKTFKLMNAGYLSGDLKTGAFSDPESCKYLADIGYLLTMVSTAYSTRGFSQYMKFRLPDLQVTSDLNELVKNNFTHVYLRDRK
jgi:hypothetical protein